MSQIFSRYAQYYDRLYEDKDYDQECDIVEALFKKYSSLPVRSILDAACGTGGHAIPLARRGYKVTGLDASPEMIRRAKDKDSSTPFYVMDLRNFEIPAVFDACICMFAAIGYLTETADVQRALARIRTHLGPGCLFIFDFWNGPAVLRLQPHVRVKTVSEGGKRIIRTVEPEMNVRRHLCTSHYHLLVLDGDRVLEEFKEAHTMRYYFPLEIAHYLEDASFSLIQLSPFPNWGADLDDTTWNAVAVARVS